MEESIVYLHNPTEFSLSPTKRRRRGMDSSEVRKCNKLDKCTRKTESAQEDLRQENAIAGDCEFEVQEQGEGWETTTSRAKRTRCMYSLQNANVLEKPAHPESLEFPPLLSRVDDGSLKPSSAAGRASSKSTECDSSASNSEDPGSDQVSEPSRGSKKLKLIGELKSHNDQQTFNVKDNRVVIDRETGEYLDLEVEKLHQSSFASSFLDPVYMDNQDVMDIVLVDVQLTVHASPRARNVPFVSLRSEAYGIAVLGYPLDVGEIRDGSETLLLSEESGDRGSRFDQLVWRTSKRTPVCYVSSSLSTSISKNVQAGQASKYVEDSMLPAGEKGLLRKGKPLMKLLKNTKQFNRGKPALKKTCIPVELIFSKILEAVD